MMTECTSEVATFRHFQRCCAELEAEAGTRAAVARLRRAKVRLPVATPAHTGGHASWVMRVGVAAAAAVSSLHHW